MRPLGVPVGSVRALLALLVLGTVCGLAAFGRPVPDKMWGLTEIVFAVYFVARAASGKGN